MARYGTIIITCETLKEMAELGGDLKHAIGKLGGIGFHNDWVIEPDRPVRREIRFAVFDDMALRGDEADERQG